MNVYMYLCMLVFAHYHIYYISLFVCFLFPTQFREVVIRRMTVFTYHPLF